MQSTAAAAPSPTLYPVAQAGPNNSVFVYAGCRVSLLQPTCGGGALTNEAFYGSLSSSPSSSITWTPISTAATPAPLYGACSASPWPFASFAPDPSYSQLGAVVVAGGITLSSALIPTLPLTVLPLDSPTALSSAGVAPSSPSAALPSPRAFSSCSMIGISDYFLMCHPAQPSLYYCNTLQAIFRCIPPLYACNTLRMYAGSGSSGIVYEDLWYFPVPPSLQVKRSFACLQNVPCLVGVSIVLGWASAGVTLSLLLALSSAGGYRRSLKGTRMLWLLLGLFGTHR